MSSIKNQINTNITALNGSTSAIKINDNYTVNIINNQILKVEGLINVVKNNDHKKSDYITLLKNNFTNFKSGGINFNDVKIFL